LLSPFAQRFFHDFVPIKIRLTWSRGDSSLAAVYPGSRNNASDGRDPISAVASAEAFNIESRRVRLKFIPSSVREDGHGAILTEANVRA
jgi:hypothetical protein